MADEANADGSSWSATIIGKLIESYAATADDTVNGQPRDRWRDSPLFGHGDESPRRNHVCRPVIIGRDGRAIPVDIASFDLHSHPLPQTHNHHHHQKQQDQYDNLPIGSVLGRGEEEYVHGVEGLTSAEEACSYKKPNEWWSKPWPVVETSTSTSTAPTLVDLSDRLRWSVVSDESSKSDEKYTGKFVW